MNRIVVEQPPTRIIARFSGLFYLCVLTTPHRKPQQIARLVPRVHLHCVRFRHCAAELQNPVVKVRAEFFFLHQLRFFIHMIAVIVAWAVFA